ncbi:YidC/Oxa1 family membrane protein insertase [Fluviicoccus keumensis]|uniref:Membrane protein insertase YidC n=1 Tax=Fluviicoccus keumensis TaxID=1435465 RepID=A0A4Q7ZCW4_9GAMM|nr:membrane protein insertase YidC [Fluviicoccus keumensis]RZU48054.1 YidC/Oxa1 family membrane protein insertase [Fluviicoccus keumensis]
MQWVRNLILVGLAIVSYLLILAWQKDYGAVPPAPTAAVAPAAVPAGSDLPGAPAAPVANSDIPPAPSAAGPLPVTAVQPLSTGLVKVRTDVLDVTIDPQGGDIVNVALPGYTRTVTSEEPFHLLENSPQRVFVAQSGLIGANGPDARPEGRPLYQAQKNSWQLQPGQQELKVDLKFADAAGVEIHKIYTFSAGHYDVKVAYEVINRSTQPWRGSLYGQLKRDNTEDPSKNHQGMMGMSTYLGAAWGTPDKTFNKLQFKNFVDEPLNQTVKGGWTAIVQHYFVTAWVPSASTANQLTSRQSADQRFHFIGFTTPEFVVPAGQQQQVAATFYAGPKVQDKLKHLAPGLELTVDYGWLWFIGQILFWLLKTIHALVGNWGWAIIGLTVTVKALFFPLSAKSYKSMANMRRVTPELQRIKEQFGADRQKMSVEMMALYKRENINPVAGCLPILIQMPVFLALYWVLMESVELRHAPWLLWINDLAAMDPYFVLPLLMGATMYGQQMLNPQPTDPMQAKVLRMMPIMFTVFMLWFPSGLVLYWVVNNTLSIIQQAIITRQIEAAAKKA